MDWFSPGYKAGGPISAAINFVHATDKTELKDIRTNFGDNTRVVLAPDFPTMVFDYSGSISKQLARRIGNCFFDI